MDLQRNLLIGAIILLSFMLLTEWMAFKEERSPTAQIASQPQSAQTAVPRSDGIPEAPAAEPSQQDDLPLVSAPQTEPEEAPAGL